MGKAQRVKGYTWERRVAQILREFWPEARRGYQSRGGQEQCDVIGTPMHVECKAVKKTSMVEWMRQMAREAAEGETRTLWVKVDREPPFVAVPMEDFLTLLRRLPDDET